MNHKLRHPVLRQLALALAGIIAICISNLSAAESRLDPNKPEEAIKLAQKFTCSLVEGVQTQSWWQGSFYSRVEGEKDRELFKVIGVNVRQCKNYNDPERGPGFRSVSREIMLDLDPETREEIQFAPAIESPVFGIEKALGVLYLQYDQQHEDAPMIKTTLALIGLVTLALWLITAKPAECRDCMLTGITCYGNSACGEYCTCIQPDGPGSKGWCN